MNYSEAGKLGYLKAKEKLEANYRKIIENYELNPNKCRFCSKTITYAKRQNKYCNSSCAASYNNKIFRISETHPCLHCGKTIKKRKNRKWCSCKCHNHYKWEQTKNKITSSGEVASHNPLTTKKYLRITRGYKCEICGISEWTGKKLPLILDHIDGNSDNWKLPNLRLICSNCDSLTDTYKSRNKGNGRFSRRQRYREGKSY